MTKGLLFSYLNTLKCDRALIAGFHKEEIKEDSIVFSILIEELSKGTKSAYPIVNNIPFSIIEMEFQDKRNQVVVAVNHPDKPELCLKHLNNIGCKCIINQLLYLNDYLWGILSFQYKEIPSYVDNNKLNPQYYSLIKQYKKEIENSLLNK